MVKTCPETILWRQFKDEFPPAAKAVLFHFNGEPKDECHLCRFGEGSRGEAIRLLTFGTDITFFYSKNDWWAPLPKGPKET